MKVFFQNLLFKVNFNWAQMVNLNIRKVHIIIVISYSFRSLYIFPENVIGQMLQQRIKKGYFISDFEIEQNDD